MKNILRPDNEYIIEPYRNQKELGILLKNVIFNENNNSDCVLFGKDLDLIFNDLLSFFEPVEAAGGVVENQHEEILLIFRRGSWDLPKGKMDKGETLEETAKREVQEETGLTGLRIIRPLYFKNLLNKATYHSYILDGKPAMKISYWFEMGTFFEGNLIPQTEEDIEQVIWVPKNNVPDYFPDMYPSIVDVLKEVL